MKIKLNKIFAMLAMCTVIFTFKAIYAANFDITVLKDELETKKVIEYTVTSDTILTDFEISSEVEGGKTLPLVTSKYEGATIYQNKVEYLQTAEQADKIKIDENTSLATYTYNLDETNPVGSVTLSIGIKAIDVEGTSIIKTVTKTVDIHETETPEISLAESTVKVNGVPYAYTGVALIPDIEVTYGKKILEKDVDYTVSYENNVNVGIATITITGKGNYTGVKKATFQIKKNIASTLVSGISSKIYNGKSQTQDIVVKDGKTTLKNGRDYTLTYSNNKNSGTARVTIRGAGNYAGERAYTFKISSKDITKFNFSKVSGYTYTTKAITPNVTVKDGKTTLIKNTDYTLTYKNNINVGTATVYVKGKGNYTGEKKITFKINKRNISSVSISKLSSKTYSRKAQTQSFTLTYNKMKLKSGKDYTVSYKSNVNVGTATITIKGKGNFSGTKTVKFKITAKSITALTFNKIGNYTYTTKAIKPGVIVYNGKAKLKYGTDYTVVYKRNINVGTATIYVTGRGNYTERQKITFKITPRSISSASMSKLSSRTYTGNVRKQSISLKYRGLKLKDGADYTVSYKNNVNVGTATLTIKGKGNFSGTKTATFKIVAKNISKLSYSKVSGYVYTGKEILPDITVKDGNITLVKDIDYTVSYKNNINVGTATITIKGKGNYTGTKTITFKIIKKIIGYYIKVNIKQNVVTVYTKDENNKYTVPVRAMICSTGKYTPENGKYKIQNRWRWLGLYGGVYGQYSTQIVGDILFHSVPYTKKSVDCLEYWEYDKLGTNASLGCVRLTVKDAKWIYDNIPKGTVVEFYSSSNPGPLGKPTAMKISEFKEYRDWDPTDSNSKNPWKEYFNKN